MLAAIWRGPLRRLSGTAPPNSRFPTRQNSNLPSVSGRIRPKIDRTNRSIVMPRIVVSFFAFLAAASLASPPAALAQAQSVFKCIDSEGLVAFQAVPCKPGLRESRVAIDPAPPASASPDYKRQKRPSGAAPRTSRSRSRQAAVYSFECRTRSGMLFYRHDRCPGSIDRSDLIGGRHRAPREAVSARRIPRLQACRGMRSVGRDGREFDDVPSTYERNLGRDPCRRY
jgi:hypothetical protein